MGVDMTAAMFQPTHTHTELLSKPYVVVTDANKFILQ